MAIKRLFPTPILVAAGYLVFLTLVEIVVMLVAVQVGLVLYCVLLILLLLHAARCAESSLYALLVGLCLIPTIRILSFSLPLPQVPRIYWDLSISVCLYPTAFLIGRTLNFSQQEVGVNPGRMWLQLLIGLTGLGFGYVQYQLLKPAPLIQSLTLGQLWLPTLILLVCTGFVEEFVFRGVLQRAAIETLGKFGGVYVGLLYAMLHIGYGSWLAVLFVLGVSLFFSWTVYKTGSISGVSLSHGLINIMVFLVLPLLPGSGG